MDATQLREIPIRFVMQRYKDLGFKAYRLEGISNP
jgi:hypothetical protein